jgi:hypothetical protein
MGRTQKKCSVLVTANLSYLNPDLNPVLVTCWMQHLFGLGMSPETCFCLYYLWSYSNKIIKCLDTPYSSLSH